MEIYEGKRQQEQPLKSSRSPSPEPVGAASPVPGNDDSFRPILRTPPPSRAGPPPSPPVPTHPIAPVAPEPAAPLPLLPCAVCGRTFVPQSLAKHVKICEKMTVKKRKTFDSSRQRREGTDLEQYLPKNFGLPENSPFLEKSPPNTAKPTPKPKPQSVRNAITKPMAELQRCPHCNRAFGVRAFERHVEWCADKAKILPAAPAQPPQHIADAKQRLNARTQYKAPPVRGRRSSQTRDKSSNSRSASVDSSRGVSPPQPREYGDYRQGRARASESVSSNDCHDDPSPHMPVIRNSRNSQNSSSGDANVKARQARLARDLSSSRKKQDPRLSSINPSSSDLIVKKNQSTASITKKVHKNNNESNTKKHQQSKVDTNIKNGPNKPEPNIKKVQHSATDPNIKKNHGNSDLSSKKSQTSSTDLNITNIQQSNTDPDIKKLTTQAKQKNKLIARKQQQLKKLEEIVNKYSEKKKAEVEDLKDRSKLARDKSQIPIPKKTKAKKSKIESSADIDQFISDDIREMTSTDINDNIKAFSTSRSSPSEASEAHKKSRMERDKKIKLRTKKDTKIAKEVSMSLDSLEECPTMSGDRNCQSIGINTELLCVPCIIHDNPDQKKINKKNKSSRKDKKSAKEPESNTNPEPVVELLYKNPTISNCMDRNYMSDSYIKLDTINSNVDSSLVTPSTSGNCIDEMDSISDVTRRDINISLQIIEDIQISNANISADSISEKIDEEIHELSEERFEVDYEHDLSAEVSCNGSIENKYDEENIKEEMGRHGSGETYTKFIEDPADLEEFMHITDKLLSNDQVEQECSNVVNDLDQFHTPKTNSIEAIDQKMSDTTINESVKHEFSDTFEELKNNLRELLKGAGNSVSELSEAIKKSEETNGKATSLPDINRSICDMEHITIYELKLEEDNHRDEKDSCFKLPAITVSNKPGNKVECDNRKMHMIYKPNKKFKMLGEQTRTNKEYQTFIVKQNINDNSDGSVTSDVPPLKLPRIENKSSNNIGSESLFPSSVKRSTSLLDSIQKKNTLKIDSGKSRHKSDQLEQDLMQSLKDFDKFYENEKNENQSSKEMSSYNGTAKRDIRIKTERKIKKVENHTNGNHTPNGKQSNDSAYSRLVSLNRISPSKLSLCTSKEPNGLTSLEQIPAGSDSSGSHKEDVRSISSDEFLAMERSAELDEPLPPPDLLFKEQDNHIDKRVSSRASSRQSPTWRPRASLSSSGSEASLARRRDQAPAQCRRPSRFCHECGNKFPVDTAKFCIECGVKRLVV